MGQDLNWGSTFACWTAGWLLITAWSCDSEDQIVPVEQLQVLANVDEELKPHFLTFEAEGLRRGLQIDLSDAGITGAIEEIQEEEVVGQCAQHNHNPNKVTVDQEFWMSASDLYKEFIVFHELGHCYLTRGHLDDAYPNGQCLSIMRSGLGDCWDVYNGRTRKNYLDELFNSVEYP